MVDKNDRRLACLYVCAFCRSFVIYVCVFIVQQKLDGLSFSRCICISSWIKCFGSRLSFSFMPNVFSTEGTNKRRKKEWQYFARQLPIELFSVLVSIALGIVSIYVSLGHCVYTRKMIILVAALIQNTHIGLFCYFKRLVCLSSVCNRWCA